MPSLAALRDALYRIVTTFRPDPSLIQEIVHLQHCSGAWIREEETQLLDAA